MNEVFDRPEFLETVGSTWSKIQDKDALRRGQFPISFGQLAFSAFKVC